MDRRAQLRRKRTLARDAAKLRLTPPLVPVHVRCPACGLEAVADHVLPPGEVVALPLPCPRCGGEMEGRRV